jgi:lipid-binding SYLF domain-containing protein
MNFFSRGSHGIIGLLLSLFLCPPVEALASANPELERRALGVLSNLYRRSGHAVATNRDAVAVLIFPDVRKLGLGVTVQTSTGVLFRKFQPIAYFNMTGLSCGLEAGVQKYDCVYFFMTEEALDHLNLSGGFEVDCAPALVFVDGMFTPSVSLSTRREGIRRFLFNYKGLMANFGIQATKLSEFIPSR